jgi:hypothetical protein
MLTISPHVDNVTRGAEHEAFCWDFADYMLMHSHAENLNGSLSGPGVVVPAVTPLYIVPSSHAEPHIPGVYASPYPVSQHAGGAAGPYYHSTEYHHYHQLAGPTNGDVGNVSWEQFMSSMGL